jgi:cell division septation protein DedD
VLPRIKPQPPAQSATAASLGKGYRLQFGAFRELEGAKSLREELLKRQARQLSGLSLVIEPPREAEAQALHRLRSSPLPDREAAAALCAKLKAAGYACFVFASGG